MLHFKNLSKLDTHLDYLTKKMLAPSPDAGKSQTCPAICGNLFLVGGCIRDLLLDIEENPTDIDLTLAGKPEEIYKNIDKEGLSCFMTEKFGTMTLIKKSVKSIKSKVSKVGNEDL
jgi:tRNA nucleotidyltransferase/poly(A) polymerase